MRILAISGSLRAASSNTALLRAAQSVAVGMGLEIEMWDGLADLPAFNPDAEGAEPAPVLDFRRRLTDADGVLISTPEYAHGVPGALKNALDWVVTSGELVDKPVALLNASLVAKHAQASLAETITVMSARLVATEPIPLGGNRLGVADIMAMPEAMAGLRQALAQLVAECDFPRSALQPTETDISEGKPVSYGQRKDRLANPTAAG